MSAALAVHGVCFAYCPPCRHHYAIGCVVPCPLSVFVAALRAARCPKCGDREQQHALVPGKQPPAAEIAL